MTDRVAVVCVPTFGVIVDPGVKLEVAPAIASSPETVKATAELKVPTGRIFNVNEPAVPLGTANCNGLV